MSDPKKIIEMLGSLRMDLVRYESHVVNAVGQILSENGISYQREVRLGPRCRVDIMTDSGIVIEVKKGKPNSGYVKEQIRRYASFDSVSSVILVSERGLASHLRRAHGKNIYYMAISKNWGIGL